MKLWEGNVFTGVCLSTVGVGYLCYQVLSEERISRSHVPSGGGGRVSPRSGGYFGGRYVSYWNAFLFKIFFYSLILSQTIAYSFANK